MTYKEFLDWLDEDTRAEWVEGRVELASPASLRHQLLSGFLSRLLWSFVHRHGLGVVLYAPFQCKLGPELPGREPDVLVVLREHLDRLRNTWLEGAPDLVVEICSPESAGRDRGEKYLEYEAAGVREYWLIDPDREEAGFFVRDHQGRFRAALLGREGTFQSSALQGFWIEAAWLWADPLPDDQTLAARTAGAEGGRTGDGPRGVGD